MKRRVKYLATLLILIFVSCAAPPATVVCTELSDKQGWCTWTTRDEEFYVDEQHKFEGKNWQELDNQSLRIPASYFAELKAYIINQCEKNNECKKQIKGIDKKLEEMVARLNRGSDTN